MRRTARDGRPPWRASGSRWCRRTASALLLVVHLGGTVGAAPILLPVRGRPAANCLAGWAAELGSAEPPRPRARPRVTCEDGTACDVDGAADGVCIFRLQLCFGTGPEDGACTPEAIGLVDLLRPSPQAARRKHFTAETRTVITEAVAALGQPIAPGQCTAELAVALPLRTHNRTRKLTIRSRAHAADGRGRDTDKLQLACTRPRGEAAPQRIAVILTTDFTNVGAYSTVLLDAPRRVRTDLGTSHSDAVARAFRGRLYIVNRLGQDNIQVVDPDSGRTLSICSVGNGSNPQDIAFADDETAYVSALGDGVVRVVDPTVPPSCTGFRRGRIDLGRFADADGTAELGRMVVVGDRLYVAVLRLDRNRGFVPAGRGMVAVVDIHTGDIIDADPATPSLDAIPLLGANPFGLAHDPASGHVWAWTTGSFFTVGDGGIEAIDPATNRNLGMIASETTLGGSVTVAAPYTRERAFAVVADARFGNRLVAFSPTTGQVLQTLRSGESYYPDIEVNERGELWLADRTLRMPGVRIFDAASGAALAGPIDVGLPPFDITFVK